MTANRLCRPTLVNAFERRDIAVVATTSNNNMMDADGLVIGHVVAHPFTVPPLHPRVALALDCLADRRIALGVHVSRDVAGRNAEAAKQAGGEMRDVLADALATFPRFARAGLHAGRARHVLDGVVDPRRDAQRGRGGRQSGHEFAYLRNECVIDSRAGGLCEVFGEPVGGGRVLQREPADRAARLSGGPRRSRPCWWQRTTSSEWSSSRSNADTCVAQ